MRRRRTIYHNDARHSYLWYFEPPMRLEDAWIPIDEVAGTAVDTFSYCVERGDGMFYPTKVGKMFSVEDGKAQSAHNYEWRAAACMLSLMERGLDPLQVLIDRAHEHGMDFIADLRLQRLGLMYPESELENGGGGWAEERVRDLKFDILHELVTEYPTQGVELDFTAAFGGGKYFYFADGGTPENTATMTEWVRRVSEMVRSRPEAPGVVGARIFPTEKGNLDQGLDVRTWLNEGLLDFVVPVAYIYTVLDPNMPFDWVVGPAHESGASVYGFLQHHLQDEVVGANGRLFPNLEHFRAAAANYWEKGVDGLYTWMMDWPLGDAERNILTMIGSPELVRGKDKLYAVSRSYDGAERFDYRHHLPYDLCPPLPTAAHTIPFTIADDIAAEDSRVGETKLRIYLSNVVAGDRFKVALNGRSLADETMRRVWKKNRDAYPHTNQRNHWLEFDLVDIVPHKGENLLEVSLESRPEGLTGNVTIAEVEVEVRHNPYPAGLE
ncbi:MAG: hypothetical protein OXD46_16850 [Chloroflexi bacterium]|nr:hypothetical protein [Chloroflexota bacterium]